MTISTLETQNLNIRTYAEQFKGNTYDEAIILLGLKLPKEPIQDPLDYENEDLYYLDPWSVGACLNTALMWNRALEVSGKALPLIITGGTTAGENGQTNEATEMARYMIKYFPQVEPYLILEDEAFNIKGNAENSCAIIDELVKANVLTSRTNMYVMTRSDHAPRARDIFDEISYKRLTETAMPYKFVFLDEIAVAAELLYYYENDAKGTIQTTGRNFQLQRIASEIVEEVYRQRSMNPGYLEKLVFRPMNSLPETRWLLDLLATKRSTLFYKR